MGVFKIGNVYPVNVNGFLEGTENIAIVLTLDN